MRAICVVTGTRAEYGLLRWLIVELKLLASVRVQIVACAAHLSPEFGSSYRVIEADGNAIDSKVEMLLSGDTPSAVAKSVGVGCIGFADAFRTLRPDLVVLLGDRFELLAAAFAALIARIPIAHIAGGERTEGAVDDSIRHAITKMAALHFTGTEEYRRRVIQMGEEPDRVFNVGTPGIDHIRRVTLLDRKALGEALGFPLTQPYLVVTYHPETLSNAAPMHAVSELLAALDGFAGQVVITSPNADAHGREMIAAFRAFAAERPGRVLFATNLDNTRYLSLAKGAAAVVGNSSSGIIEAPALGTPTVNIGDRQKGRIRMASIIDCTADRAAITAAIRHAGSAEFRVAMRGMTNPYGDGTSSQRMAKILSEVDLPSLAAKRFRDLPLPPSA